MSGMSSSFSLDRQITSCRFMSATNRRSSHFSRDITISKSVFSVRRDRSTLLQAEKAQASAFRWPEWGVAWRFLTDNGIQSVTAQRGQEMVDSGKWLLVDVRPSATYEKCHPTNAVTVPLFDNMDWSNASPMAYLRAAAYLVNGVSPVSINEEFDAQLDGYLKDGKGLIFYCETGGTMVPSTNFIYGKQSRSLKACYRALKADPSIAVAHLEGGLFGWYQAGLPLVGEYDTSNVGRTPNTAKAPEIKPEN